MLRFTVEVMGEEQVLRAFSRFGDAVKDLTPFWPTIADDFRELEEKQFDTQGGSGSGGWTALSPAYATWKARHYPGKGILVRTGALRSSLTTGGAGHIEKKSADRLEIGTSVPYAIYHQKGTRKMPKRPPVELSEADKMRWSKALHKFLISEAKKEGLL